MNYKQLKFFILLLIYCFPSIILSNDDELDMFINQRLKEMFIQAQLLPDIHSKDSISESNIVPITGFENQIPHNKSVIVKIIADGLSNSIMAIISDGIYSNQIPNEFQMLESHQTMLGISQYSLHKFISNHLNNYNYDNGLIYIDNESISNIHFFGNDEYGGKYIYENGKSIKVTENNNYLYESFYNPSPNFQHDVLVFLFPQRRINKTDIRLRKKKSHFRSITQIYENLEFDLTNMTENAFMKKYDLLSVYSNKVFHLAKKCIFRLSTNDTQQLYSKHFGEDTIITFTRPEISELVYLSHLVNYPNDTNAYKQIVSRSPEYIDLVQNPKTELGKMVYERLKEIGIIGK